MSFVGINVAWDAATLIDLPVQRLVQGWPLVHVACLGGHPPDHVGNISPKPATEALVVVHHDGHPKICYNRIKGLIGQNETAISTSIPPLSEEGF